MAGICGVCLQVAIAPATRETLVTVPTEAMLAMPAVMVAEEVAEAGAAAAEDVVASSARGNCANNDTRVAHPWVDP